MTERIDQGGEDPADVAARRAAWRVRTPDRAPITARELADALKAKGVIVDADLPRRGPPV